MTNFSRLNLFRWKQGNRLQLCVRRACQEAWLRSHLHDGAHRRICRAAGTLFFDSFVMILSNFAKTPLQSRFFLHLWMFQDLDFVVCLLTVERIRWQDLGVSDQGRPWAPRRWRREEAPRGAQSAIRGSLQSHQGYPRQESRKGKLGNRNGVLAVWFNPMSDSLRLLETKHNQTTLLGHRFQPSRVFPLLYRHFAIRMDGKHGKDHEGASVERQLHPRLHGC